MGLFDPGPETLILLLIIIALLFGTNRLPQLVRALGRAQVEYRRGREQIQRQFEEAAAEAEHLEGTRRAAHGQPENIPASGTEAAGVRKRRPRTPAPNGRLASARAGPSSEQRRPDA